MKLSKKAITALSFTVGACVFVSTAFADTLIGSGYDHLKTTVKNTAAQMENGLGNYTVEALITLKENDRSLVQMSTFSKIDTQLQATENTSSSQYASGEQSSSYSYSDKKQSVWKNNTDGKYYVTEFPEEMSPYERRSFTNPFNEKGAPEVEKIVDAFVGNLKENIQAELHADGGRVYAGSLSEAQVPAVVNAVSSFVMKRYISDMGRLERMSLPQIEDDIFVKKVTGTAVENKAGLLESLTGEVVLSGKDKEGVQHDIKLNMAYKLSDIGQTKISLPDLSGANVEKITETGGFSNKHVGIYKNNVITEKDGKFIKIGERTLEITNVEKNKVSGKYYETVKPGYEAEFGELYNFTFEYNPASSGSMPTFTYKNAKGEQELGQLHPSSNGKLYLNMNMEILSNDSYRSNDRPNFDGEFSRVFEE
ncbi:hypothetical protein [Paenibacillus puerhi]|uniref:hypothetical protein n=1 Tax=Paenibacillus puerhi TaxID=2692622 RepID=UPI00135C1E23|nr:hypothetical protein [Paenibacillus puerhi]